VVKRILDRHGEINQRELGEELDVARSTIACALNGHRRNPVLQMRIALRFGFDPRELWGSWYDPAGRRVSAAGGNGRGRRNGRRRSSGGKGAKAGARPARIAG
jgi:lambda repressor-like predicted transcriptional regulator